MEPSVKILLTLLCIGICTKTCFSQTFTAFAKTCSDCDVANNAICEQKPEGYVVCSCPAGSIGNGHKCTKMVNCAGYNCCPSGYSWDLAGKKCLDNNECNIPTQNMCSPSSTCQNMKGVYLCNNINKAPCLTDPCPDNLDCLTINGNAKCADPCTKYLQLNGDARLFTINSTGKFITDRNKVGWYRYTGNIAVGMKEGCVGALKCGSLEPYSLGGPHPAIGEGVKMVPLLINGINSCSTGSSIPVKACPGDFYVYKLTGMLKFDVYCTEPVKPSTTPPTPTTPPSTTPTPTTPPTTTPTPTTSPTPTTPPTTTPTPPTTTPTPPTSTPTPPTTTPTPPTTTPPTTTPTPPTTTPKPPTTTPTPPTTTLTPPTTTPTPPTTTPTPPTTTPTPPTTTPTPPTTTPTPPTTTPTPPTTTPTPPTTTPSPPTPTPLTTTPMPPTTTPTPPTPTPTTPPTTTPTTLTIPGSSTTTPSQRIRPSPDFDPSGHCHVPFRRYCCPGRDDSCYRPSCYCDKYCQTAGDCCDDYIPLCIGDVSTTAPDVTTDDTTTPDVTTPTDGTTTTTPDGCKMEIEEICTVYNDFRCRCIRDCTWAGVSCEICFNHCKSGTTTPTTTETTTPTPTSTTPPTTTETTTPTTTETTTPTTTETTPPTPDTTTETSTPPPDTSTPPPDTSTPPPDTSTPPPDTSTPPPGTPCDDGDCVSTTTPTTFPTLPPHRPAKCVFDDEIQRKIEDLKRQFRLVSEALDDLTQHCQCKAADQWFERFRPRGGF